MKAQAEEWLQVFVIGISFSLAAKACCEVFIRNRVMRKAAAQLNLAPCQAQWGRNVSRSRVT